MTIPEPLEIFPPTPTPDEQPPPRRQSFMRRHLGWFLYPAVFILGAVVIAAGVVAVSATATPKECGQAISRAQQVMDIDDEAFGYASAALHAVSQFDTDTVNANSAKIRDLIPRKQAAYAAYSAAAAQCTGD